MVQVGRTLTEVDLTGRPVFSERELSNDSDTTCRLNELILDSNDVIVRPNCDGGWQGIRGQSLPRVQGTGDVLLALRNASSTTLGA